MNQVFVSDYATNSSVSLGFFGNRANPNVDIRYNVIMEINVWLLNKKQVSQTAF